MVFQVAYLQSNDRGEDKVIPYVPLVETKLMAVNHIIGDGKVYEVEEI